MASSSSIFTAVTDNEDSNRVVIKNERKSRVMDVVLGRGGFVGAYFVSVMAKWCDTYSSTKANQKNALIKEIVSELLENGCRFLDWEKKKTSCSFSSKPNRLVVVQCKSRISNKIKRYLREMSRERHSYEMKLRAKQQQQLQHAHRQQQPFLFTENYDVVASSSANQNAKKKKRKPNSAAFPLPSLQPTVMVPSLESSSSNTKKTSSNEEFCHRPPKKWKAATTESHATPSYSSIANSDKIKQDTRSLNAHTHCLEATTGIPIAPYPAIDNTNRTTELLLPKLYNSGNNSGQQWIVGTMTAAKSPSLSRTTALEPKTEEQSGNGDQEEIAMPPLPAAMQEQQQERHQQQQPRRSSIATVASASSLTRPPVFLTCDSGSLSVNPQFLADLKFLTPLQSPDIEEQQRPERNYPGAEASWETTRDDWVNSSSPSSSSDKDTNKDDDINNISTIHNTNIVATNKHHHNVLSPDNNQRMPSGGAPFPSHLSLHDHQKQDQPVALPIAEPNNHYHQHQNSDGGNDANKDSEQQLSQLEGDFDVPIKSNTGGAGSGNIVGQQQHTVKLEEELSELSELLSDSSQTVASLGRTATNANTTIMGNYYSSVIDTSAIPPTSTEHSSEQQRQHPSSSPATVVTETPPPAFTKLLSSLEQLIESLKESNSEMKGRIDVLEARRGKKNKSTTTPSLDDNNMDVQEKVAV